MFLSFCANFFHSVFSLEFSFSVISEFFSLFEVVFFRSWYILIFLNSFHFFSSLKCSFSQVLLLLEIVLVLDTFLNFCPLFILYFCLSFGNVQRINNISKRFVYWIVLERSSVCTDSHVNWNCITSWIFPIRDARWDFPVLHVFFSEFSWRWSMKWRRWWAWSRRKLSVFMLSWENWINLYSVDSDNSLLVTFSSFTFWCKLDNFRICLSKFLDSGSICCLFFNTKDLIDFLSCRSDSFLILFIRRFLQLLRIEISVGKYGNNWLGIWFVFFFDDHVLKNYKLKEIS